MCVCVCVCVEVVYLFVARVVTYSNENHKEMFSVHSALRYTHYYINKWGSALLVDRSRK